MAAVHTETDAPDRAAYRLAALVALAAFALYITIQRAAVASYDGKIMVDVARNLLQNGSLATTSDEFGFNTPYSTYGIGTSLLAVPFVGLQLLIDDDGGTWITLANPMVFAIAAGIVVLIGCELGWRRWVAVATGLGFATLTMAPVQSTEMFSEPGVTLGVTLALLGLLQWQRGSGVGPWLVGVGVAGAVLFRSDSILLVGALALCIPLFVPFRRLLETRRDLVACGLPVALSLVWVGWYNWFRYDSVTELGYQDYGFTTPLTDGLYLLVVSPGKGFFWYNPILFAAIPGIVWLWRRNRGTAAVVVLLCVLRVVFYARWEFPEGGVSWGPRFLMPLGALLAIPAGEALERVAAARDRWLRAAGAVAFAGLAGVAGIITITSIWVPYEQWWNSINYKPPGEDPNEVFRRIDDYYYTWGASHIRGNLALMERDNPPFHHWWNGPNPVGVGSLLIGVGVAGYALVSAVQLDRRRRSPVDPEPGERVIREPDPPNGQPATESLPTLDSAFPPPPPLRAPSPRH